jgi:hypothetical protein
MKFLDELVRLLVRIVIRKTHGTDVEVVVLSLGSLGRELVRKDPAPVAVGHLEDLVRDSETLQKHGGTEACDTSADDSHLVPRWKYDRRESPGVFGTLASIVEVDQVLPGGYGYGGDERAPATTPGTTTAGTAAAAAAPTSTPTTPTTTTTRRYLRIIRGPVDIILREGL